RALRQHQHVESVERWLEFLDRSGIADVELRVIQALEGRSLARRIIGSRSAGAADMDARALSPESLRDAVADAAGAAHHENLLAAEIQFVHRPRSSFTWFDLSGERCQPCQSWRARHHLQRAFHGG